MTLIRNSPSGPEVEVEGSSPSYAAFVSVDIDAGEATMDLAASGIFSLTLTEDITTFNQINLTEGDANFFTLRIVQDGVGGHGFIPPASWTFSTGAYIPTAAAGAADLLQGITYDDGATWLVSYLPNYI